MALSPQTTQKSAPELVTAGEVIEVVASCWARDSEEVDDTPPGVIASSIIRTLGWTRILISESARRDAVTII